MHERKSRMFDLSDGFVALPGGFGTMEEMFEMLTWRQFGIGNKPCAFLDADGFYAPLIGMIDRIVEERFLHAERRTDLLARRGHRGDAAMDAQLPDRRRPASGSTRSSIQRCAENIRALDEGSKEPLSVCRLLHQDHAHGFRRSQYDKQSP